MVAIRVRRLTAHVSSSQEALNKANAMGLPSPGGHVPIPAPASSKQQQQQQGKGQAKANAGRGTASSQRGREPGGPGRGGPPVPLRNLPQPRSRGPTPPPRPAGEPHTLVKLAMYQLHLGTHALAIKSWHLCDTYARPCDCQYVTVSVLMECHPTSSCATLEKYMWKCVTWQLNGDTAVYNGWIAGRWKYGGTPRAAYATWHDAARPDDGPWTPAHADGPPPAATRAAPSSGPRTRPSFP